MNLFRRRLGPLLGLGSPARERAAATALLLILVVGASPTAVMPLLAQVDLLAGEATAAPARRSAGALRPARTAWTAPRPVPRPIPAPRWRSVRDGGLPAPRAPDRA